jgi:uncharacterized phage protein gp47/JayE
VPYSRPTLGDLWTRIGALWRATYPGADTNLRNSPDRAVVGVLARATDEDLSFMGWVAEQIFPFSAATEYLERWAAWKNVQRRGATPGAGTVSFVGATPGMTAVQGTELQTADGTVVALSADATAGDDGSVTAPAAAVLEITSLLGAHTNLGTGVVLTFIGTPAGFPDTGAVAGTFAGGADAETDAALRLRTQRRYSQPSFGGNQNDWQNAVLGVQGVTRVFTAAATPTPGAVTIYPLFDDVRPNGIPAGTDAWFRPGTSLSSGIGGDGDQRAVLDAILVTRPICAGVYVKAAATQALNLTISGLVTASDAVKAAIATEIAKMLIAKLAQSDAQLAHVGALSSGYTIYLEWISAAIAQAAGVTKFVLTVPAAAIVVPPGTILVPGVNTYV